MTEAEVMINFLVWEVRSLLHLRHHVSKKTFSRELAFLRPKFASIDDLVSSIALYEIVGPSEQDDRPYKIMNALMEPIKQAK
jgi:hypothetical protein